MPKLVGLLQTRAARDRRFRALVLPHLGAMYRMAWRWTRHDQDAEDLVQDALTKLIDRVEELGEVDKLQPWLIKVMYRTWVDRWRKRQRTPGEDPADYHDDFLEGVAGSNGLDNLELYQDLQRALDGLPWEQRDVVLLHDVEGYALLETASILDISEGTVKSRLHRARGRLKKFLENGTFSVKPSCYEPET